MQYPFQIYCLGGPQTTLSFDASQGLTELRKAVIPMVMVYYRERTQIKISKWKKFVRQSPGEVKSKLPVESHEQFLFLPADECGNMMRCPAGKLT